MFYNFQNKWRFGGDSFSRRTIKSVIEIASVLLITFGFFYLGFLGSLAVKKHREAKVMMLNKEISTIRLMQNNIDDKNSEHYCMTSEERKNKQEKKTEESVKIVSRGGYSVTNRELDLLERVVMAEAGGEPYEGQIAVVNVIMNRVASKSYPNTVSGVIFQKGQFTPAINGRIWKMKPSESVKKAVREALGGKRVVEKDVLYFLNPDIATDHTIPRTKKFVKRIGRHAFYK